MEKEQKEYVALHPSTAGSGTALKEEVEWREVSVYLCVCVSEKGTVCMCVLVTTDLRLLYTLHD